jgi:hypothetical protein
LDIPPFGNTPGTANILISSCAVSNHRITSACPANAVAIPWKNPGCRDFTWTGRKLKRHQIVRPDAVPIDSQEI